MPTEQYFAARKKALAWEEQHGNPLHLTHEDLDALADQALVHLAECGETGADRKTFTCYRCPAAAMCPYVYDIYNRSGDCLADK